MRISAFLLLSLLFSQAMGQNTSTRIKDSGWRFGLNIGGAYQGTPFGEQDKLDPGFGMGFGFTLGHMLYQRRGEPINVGLRGRFLWETTSGTSTEPHYAIGTGPSWKERYDLDHVGQNYQDEAGYVFPNYRQEGRQYDLELTVGLNRLAEQTNLYLYAFGGVGVINYNVHTDQLDDNGDPYDYASLSGNASKNDLESMWDGDHETRVYEGGKVNRFIPSGGLGLLYQINPSLGIGFEHKVSFPHKEDLFDAKEYKNASPDASFGDYEKTAKSDIYHYTALKFRWRLISRGNGDDDEEDQATPTPSPGQSSQPDPQPEPQPDPPRVRIEDPSQTPHRTRSELYPLRAKLDRVDKRENVALWVNGDRVGDFSFNPGTGVLKKEIELQGGANQIQVQGVNEAGKDKDRAVIVHLDERPEPPAPKVRITDPSQNPETYYKPIKELEADVLNVDSKGDIEFRFNGSSHSFQFEPNNGRLTAELQLIQGANTVHIDAENEGGKDEDERTIIYVRKAQVEPPRVNISYPTNDPEVVLDPNQGVVQARVENVDSRAQLTVTLNGNVVQNYQFYPQSSLLTLNRPLQPGNNVFRIKARNDGGRDQDSRRIILEDEQKDPPQVDFVDPASNGNTVSFPNYTIKVRVRHVSKKQNVELRVNGAKRTNFHFDHTQAMLTYNASLQQGSNQFHVTANNSEGSDADQVSIRYQPKSGNLPTVSFQKPSKLVSQSSNGKAELKAAVTHVQDRSNIQVLVNGSQTNKFSFNASKGEVRFNRNLIKGQNQFTVKVSNAYGNDQDHRTITYDPVQPPAVKIIKPSSDPHMSPQNNIVIKGKVTGVNNSQGLELRANGNKVNNFQFVGGLFKFQMNLQKGKNEFKVTASNSAGQASDEVVIHHAPPKNPQGSGTNPNDSKKTQPQPQPQPKNKQGSPGTPGNKTEEEKDPQGSSGKAPAPSSSEEEEKPKETKKSKKTKKESKSSKKKSKKTKKSKKSSSGSSEESGSSNDDSGKKKKKK